MKLRRSSRLVDMTQYLLRHPHKLVSLSYFSERYNSAKSSISEDLSIIKQAFEERGNGTLQTVTGASGGIKYIPDVSKEMVDNTIQELCKALENPERILPGGYLYITDIFGNPEIINRIGLLYASAFSKKSIDVVMTVATQGVALAYAVARYLNIPVVIARRGNEVTEGSMVSINYVSGSSNQMQTMVLSKRSISSGANVLIIDDFMRSGGTVNGMVSLLEEFNANVVGIGVVVELHDVDSLESDYISLVKLESVNMKEKSIVITSGNYFQNKNGGDFDAGS